MTREDGRAAASLGVGVGLTLGEGLHLYSTTVFRRFDEEATSWASRRLGGENVGRPGFIQPDLADFARLGVESYLTTEHVGNLVLNAGWTRLMNLLTGQGGGLQAYDATHTRIGLGTSTTAAAYTQTDLQAAVNSSNRYWKLVSGAGSLGTRTLAFSAAVGTGDGNFSWQEWGIDQGTADGSDAATSPMLNRAVSDQGTKVNGQTWTITATFTFS